jgi:hypothetical protein
MFRGIVVALSLTAFSVIGCAVESGEPEPGEQEISTVEQAASDSSCRWRCTQCPPNQLCIQVCEQIGNCGGSCTSIALCVEGYVWDDTSCQCQPEGGGESCGSVQCAAGQVCCNASCGICTEPGGFCTMQMCE